MNALITLESLDAPVEVKADEGKGLGFFAALVSVFGNRDRNGDRVLPGAFTKTKERWKLTGNPVPVIYGHQHNDVSAIIGSVWPDDMKETKEGLTVAGRLDIEGNPRAAEVFAKLKAGLITSWSFAFEARDYDLADDGVRELKELEIFEVGPVLVGANDQARTLALKSVEVETPPADPEPDPIEAKAGRRISRATAVRLAEMKKDAERLTVAFDELLAEVLEEKESPDGGVAPVTQAEQARQEMAGLQAFLTERGMG